MDMSGDELWVSEPVRDKRLIVKTKQPFNAEIPPKLIVESLDTPKYVYRHFGFKGISRIRSRSSRILQGYMKRNEQPDSEK